MATLPIPVDKYTWLRVLATAIPILINIGITAGVFWGIPVVNDSLRLALRTGGATFVWLVIVPASLLALVSTVLAIRILWRASDPSSLQQDD